MMKSQACNIFNSAIRKVGFEVKSTFFLPQRNLLGLKDRFSIRTIIDVGANLGQFASWAKSHFPNASIYSFEPVKSTFTKLNANALNDPLWHVYNLALSEGTCEREINFHVDHSSSSSLLESTLNEGMLFPETRNQMKQLVQCITLDEWVANNEECFRNDVLLKMDVQGFELSVLKGGLKSVPNVAAILAEVLVEDLYISQTTFADLVSFLAQSQHIFNGVIEHGFSTDGKVISFDALFVKKQNGEN